MQQSQAHKKIELQFVWGEEVTKREGNDLVQRKTVILTPILKG